MNYQSESEQISRELSKNLDSKISAESTLQPRSYEEATPVAPPSSPQMRNISIRQLNRGYVVSCGCQELAIADKSELIENLVAYINNPQLVEKNGLMVLYFKKTIKMTKFNPLNKETLTYGECLSPAMEIKDAEDAKQYLDAYIKFQKANMQESTGRYTPEEICRINLGYYAGYYDSETRKRVELLFGCSHPIFGSSLK